MDSWRARRALCKITGSMRAIALACLGWILIAPSRSSAEAGISALELSWSAPDECGDTERVREAISQRLGERTSGRTEPLSASGRIEATPSGFSLTLRTDAGERRLEAASCGELVESAAVILALLIDPRPRTETQAEADAEPDRDAASIFSGFVRLEAFADLGLFPSLAVGPGLALGVSVFRTMLELSGSYLPTHDLESDFDALPDAGDLRAYLARLGVCQMFFERPAVGPCFLVEYARLDGDGQGMDPDEDTDPTVWSLLLAARLSVPLGDSFGWTIELAAGLPTSTAAFTVEENMFDVHESGRVVGRLRTGLELRFP